jgi:hypothetical protein
VGQSRLSRQLRLLVPLLSRLHQLRLLGRLDLSHQLRLLDL